MLVACLVVVAPASWTARAGSAAEAGAEVPCVVLVPARIRRAAIPALFASTVTRSCNTLSEVLTEAEM